MKHYSELIIQDANMDIVVGYNVEKDSEYTYPTPFGFATEISVEITLTSVEIVIAGKGIDILPQLDKNQIEAIKDTLTLYNEE